MMLPSFFECYAQDTFIATLKPAVDYGLYVLACDHVTWMRVYQWRDELFYSVLAAIDSYHLAHYDSTFSEAFYGMERVVPLSKSQLALYGSLKSASSSSTTKKVAALSTKHRVLAVLFSVVLPYLKGKLDAAYAPLVDEISPFGDLVPSEDRAELISRRPYLKPLITAYPYLNAAYELVHIVFQLGALFGKSPYFSPLLAVQRVWIRSLSRDAILEQEEISVNSRLEWMKVAGGRMIPTAALKLVFLVFDGLQYFLPLSVFMFRFFEWWNSEENHLKKKSLFRPPPAPRASDEMSKFVLDAESTKCPLCAKERTNPACGPSGVVFCFPCIFEYVQEHHRCPVSGVPFETTQVIKIFED